MTGDGPSAEDHALTAALEESRRLGFLGPGPLAPQIAHARGFASTLERAPESFLDLGAGGGIPGLVLGRCWPEARGVLLDAMVRRTEFLHQACEDLGFAPRIAVVCDRAESAARAPELRGRFAVVVARSFGPPAVTAECAAGFLAPGGTLVVSEPPTDDHRWPAEGLARLGLALIREVRTDAGYVLLQQVEALEDRYPRRVGVPRKRPLWP